jgi:hypothetical protein
VTVRVLRRALGCRLPVEIVHYGASERHEALVALLEAEGAPAAGSEADGNAGSEATVTVIDGADARFELSEAAGFGHLRRVKPGSFASKVHALVFVTSFQEVSCPCFGAPSQNKSIRRIKVALHQHANRPTSQPTTPRSCFSTPTACRSSTRHRSLISPNTRSTATCSGRVRALGVRLADGRDKSAWHDDKGLPLV